MGLVIFGEKEIPIGLDEFLIKCPSCKTSSWADILVVNHYFHFYFFILLNEFSFAISHLRKIYLSQHGISFHKKLISNYSQIKSQYRHPWFTYVGVIIIVLIILLIIIGKILSRE